MSDYDYSAIKEADAEKQKDNILPVLTAAADRAQALEKKIADLEEELKTTKEKYREVTEKEIPDIFGGTEGTLKLADGRSVEVAEKTRAGISEANQPAAFAYLDENGSSAIIKRNIVIEFGKNQEEDANKFEEHLKTLGISLNITRKKSVHHKTLEAWVKEQLAKGKDIPKDVFGVYTQKITKIKG